MIDRRPEAFDVADEVFAGRCDRPGSELSEIRDVLFAEVGDETAELLCASPMMVSPQVLRQLVVPGSIRREPREHPLKVAERPDLVPPVVGEVCPRPLNRGPRVLVVHDGLQQRDDEVRRDVLVLRERHRSALRHERRELLRIEHGVSSRAVP